MRIILSFVIVTVLYCSSCKSKDAGCMLAVENVIPNDSIRVNISFTKGVISMVRDIGKDSIIGGFYNFFKSGQLESYYFIAKKDSNYDNSKRNLALVDHGDSQEDLASFCTYAELYDQFGNIRKIYGKPLVYRNIEITGSDSMSATYYFFSLNKRYEEIKVNVQNKGLFKLDLTTDSLYSNMKKATFSCKLSEITPVVIFIEGKYLNICTNEIKNLRDTVKFKL